MSDHNGTTHGLFGKIKSVLQPKQSDCCSIGFEEIEEDAGRNATGEAPGSADAPAASTSSCCGGAVASDAPSREEVVRGA